MLQFVPSNGEYLTQQQSEMHHLNMQLPSQSSNRDNLQMLNIPSRLNLKSNSNSNSELNTQVQPYDDASTQPMIIE